MFIYLRLSSNVEKQHDEQAQDEEANNAEKAKNCSTQMTHSIVPHSPLTPERKWAWLH